MRNKILSLCTTLFRAALDNLSSDSWFGKHRQFISSSRLRSSFTEVPTVQCEQWLRTLGRIHELLRVLVVPGDLVAALVILLRKT